MKITINPDKSVVEKIRAALKNNDNHCPCSVKKSPDTKCMCKDFIEKKESGWCRCHLYYKEIEGEE